MIQSCRNKVLIIILIVFSYQNKASASKSELFDLAGLSFNSAINSKLFIADTPGNIKYIKAEANPQHEDEPGINKKRLWFTASTIAIGYTTTLILLDQAWYKNYPRSSFHFHNDNADWLQMDKMGHATSSYYINNLTYKVYKWTGLNNKQATIWGSITGWSFISAIEIFDGFSAEWGASPGDIIANTAGTALFATQQAIWEKQRFKLKFSFRKSGLESYRPNLLGSSLAENILKDYNGQTYWLSYNLSSSFSEYANFPEWLNLAIGYGANGMLGSLNNPTEHNGISMPHYERTRHWYLAPDIDWEKIPTESPFLKSVFAVFDFLKMPAPTIEYSRHYGFSFHFLFF